MHSIVHKDAEFSIIELVDRLLHQAIAQQASDIHFEPMEKYLRLRMRFDGILYDQPSLPALSTEQIISRIKVLANMNIAEKRMPQDGTFTMFVDGISIDLRVSTFPTVWGEKMVVRVLDTTILNKTLNQLGFTQNMQEQFINVISKQQGFILVTGPTGSGKTTTLYAALSYLHRPEKNIITLEDPVEYTVKGVTQGKINHDSGFSFEKGIRAILRQDPDILMVGEIRDRPTARIAIEAALTGHVILSTLHTNDAPGAIMRLLDMGIEPFLINASLTAVLAQRLIRRLCGSCKKEVSLTDDEKKLIEQFGLSIASSYKPVGCKLCQGKGYKGRIGIFELLLMSNELKKLITYNPNLSIITQQALDDGLITLRQDGIEKVNAGLISIEDFVSTLI